MIQSVVGQKRNTPKHHPYHNPHQQKKERGHVYPQHQHGLRNGAPISSQTLLSTMAQGLAKNQHGKIMSLDLKNIYSVLLVNLQLTDKRAHKNNNQRSSFFSLKTYHPFSFLEEDAITAMQTLNVEMTHSTITTAYSYEIKPELAQKLVKIFFEAKLLHCPADRTRNKPKRNGLLQPTAKGVAVLHKFVKKNGFKKADFPEILKSNFNSMELISFERSITDRIYLSEYFILLLFIRCMGPRPNVWSPNSASDVIPDTILEDLENSSAEEDQESIFNFNNFSFEDIYKDDGDADDDHKLGTCTLPSDKDKSTKLKKSKEHQQSPFMHKFFTNPESDSHIQYYLSNHGVRLFKDKRIQSGEIVDYCFSGKALWQWFMDCCDIMYKEEARLLGQLFLKQGLIEPVMLEEKAHYDVDNEDGLQFKVAKHYYYRVTALGKNETHWDKTEAEIVSSMKRINEGSHQSSVVSVGINKFFHWSQDSLPEAKRAAPIAPIAKPNKNALAQVKHNKSRHNKEAQLNNLTLLMILNDAGMRYLFRSHLDKDFCAENFDAHHQIQVFKRDMKVLRRKLEENRAILSGYKGSGDGSQNDDDLDPALKECNKLAKECLSNAISIYISYLAKGAAYEVNINYELKHGITEIIQHPRSPVARTFQESVVDSGVNYTYSGDTFEELQNSRQNHFDYKKSQSNANDDFVLSNVKSRLDSDLDQNGSALDVEEHSINSNRSSSSSDMFDASNGEAYNAGGTTLPESPTLIHHSKEISDSPTEEIFGGTLFVLNRLYLLYDKVAKHLYRLMEIDSLGKFINSDVYKQISQNTNLYDVVKN